MNAQVHSNNQRQPLSVSDLTIERIEFIPLKMPLPKTYRGSYYQMTHRCTIITRLYTRCGIVGECEQPGCDRTSQRRDREEPICAQLLSEPSQQERTAHRRGTDGAEQYTV